MNFKPGDVVIDIQGDAGIVCEPPRGRWAEGLVWAWWLYVSTDEWEPRQLHALVKNCKLHPDADRIWARWVARQLVEGED